MLSRKTESKLISQWGFNNSRLSPYLKDIFIPSRVQILGLIVTVLAFTIGYSIAYISINPLQSHLEAEFQDANSELKSLRTDIITKDSEISDLKAALSDINSTLQSKTLALSDAERYISNIQEDLSLYNKTISISATGTEYVGLPYETIRKLTIFLTWIPEEGWTGFGFYTEKFDATNRILIIDVIKMDDIKVSGFDVELLGTISLTTREDLLLGKEVVITATDKGPGFKGEEVILQFPTFSPPQTIMLLGSVELNL